MLNEGKSGSGGPFCHRDRFHPHTILKTTGVRENANVLKHCFLYIAAAAAARGRPTALCWLLVSALTGSRRLSIPSQRPVSTCDGGGRQKMEDPGLEIYAVLFPSCKQRRLPGHPRIQTSGTGAPPGALEGIGVTFLPRWNVSPSPQHKSFLADVFSPALF